MSGEISGMEQLENSPMKKLSRLSPQRYRTTANKNSSYTPQKLENNYMYKEVTITKRIETQKNKTRELQSVNALLEDKIRHLTEENSTQKMAYQQQLQMYKRILRQQEQETKRLLKNLRSECTMEIQKILLRHEEDSKVSQAQKQDLQGRIQELLAKIAELQNQLEQGLKEFENLTSKYHITSQHLIGAEDKLVKAEDHKKVNIEKLNKELTHLNNKMIQDNINFKQQLDAQNNDRIREIQGLRRQHLADIDKLNAKRDAELNQKKLQMNDSMIVFESETRRLEAILNNKDRVNEALGGELKKEKQRNIALTRNYDLEIGKLVNEKDHILSDLTHINDQKIMMGKELAGINVLFDAERGRNAVVVNSLQAQIEKKNIELAAENQRLLRTINQYQKQIVVTAHNTATFSKTLEIQKSEEVRRLMMQIRNLKEILVQSSSQMQRCKEQFVRMQVQKQHLIRMNRQTQAQSLRLRALVSEQDTLLRLKRF